MKELTVVAAELLQARSDEAAAKARRVALEREIVQHQEIARYLKPVGTTNFGDLKIVTNQKREWDQKALVLLANAIKPEFFPFKTKESLVEDRRKSKEIEERYPELWSEISEALTISPSAPQIKFVAAGEDDESA